MFKLVALDMDGTLLNKDHEISQRSADVLRKLAESGVIVSIATGRSSGSVTKYVTGALKDIPQAIFPMVCFNGSCCLIRDQSNGDMKTLFKNDLSEEAVHELIATTKEQGLVMQFYNGVTGEVFVNPDPSNQVHLDLVARYAKLVGKEQTIVDRENGYDALMSSGIYPVKVLALTPEENVDKVFEKELSVNLHTIRGSPFPFFVEYLMPNNNKGTAIEALCKHLGIGLSEVVAFGDGENDAEMLEAVGKGVAMKNARPKAKTAANEVTEFTNDDDGVAIHLEKLFNL